MPRCRDLRVARYLPRRRPCRAPFLWAPFLREGRDLPPWRPCRFALLLPFFGPGFLGMGVHCTRGGLTIDGATAHSGPREEARGAELMDP